MPYFINAHRELPDRKNYTQLEIKDALAAATFKYFMAGRQRYALWVEISGLFLPRFSGFDLANRRMFWGHVEYAPQGTPTVAEYDEKEKKIVLIYKVAGRVFIPDRPQPPEPPQAVINYPPPPPQEPPLPPNATDSGRALLRRRARQEEATRRVSGTSGLGLPHGKPAGNLDLRVREAVVRR